MQDGQNLFFPDEAFLGKDWEVDETMELLDTMNVVDRVIVVGVYSEDRMDEYTKPGYEAYGAISSGAQAADRQASSGRSPGPRDTG